MTHKHFILCLAFIGATLGGGWEGARTSGVANALAADGDRLDAEKLAKVQAAFVLNFVKFTTWPQSSFAGDSSPLVVAVVCKDEAAGRDRAAVLSATLGGRMLEKHPITVRLIEVRSDAQRSERKRELNDVHVAFICLDSDLSSGDISGLNSRALLTIGAEPADASRGAILSLGVDRGKVVFFYNADAARSSPLILSSKLLALARVP